MAEYTVEDERIIGDYWEKLLASCRGVAKTEADLDNIQKAFFLAKEAHKGARRRSGEPYILHPIAVAQIVVDEIGLGTKSVIAALLHDVVEDTAYTVEDIQVMFGSKIASMVDGLTKMAGVFTEETVSVQAENFRKMLLTLSDDLRVILIKIADRLHNMRTLGSMSEEKRVKISSETAYLFAPLAYRLGLYSIKTELEDLSLKYRFPDEYEEIDKKLEATSEGRQKYIDTFNQPIVKALRDSGIDFEISGRVKSVFSIWSKMKRKNVTFEEVYDLFAIRIIFKPSALIPEKSQCWHIYSLITDIYKPKPDRIRDWVNIPKANGYEALHATVMGPGGFWVEVQIRSTRMEEIAERGFAAHWKYKDNASGEAYSEDELEKWLRKAREALSGPTDDAVDFLDNFRMTLYASEVVAFTPKGEVRTLPKGATALDFAYDIHTKIGNKAIGAKINHKISSIITPIMSGDQIEIITSNNAEPKAEWLEHVITAKAKQSIKAYFRKDNNNLVRGIEIFDSKLKELGIQPSARVFRKVLPAYQCNTKDEFYSNLGIGAINLDDLREVLRENASNKTVKMWSLQLANPLKFLTGNDKKSGRGESSKWPWQSNRKAQRSVEPAFTIARCCYPIPGDKVVGYRNPDTKKIEVHKASCDEAVRLAAQHGNRITPVQWSSYKAETYLSEIEMRGLDRVGITLELAQLITDELNINIREIHMHSHDGIFEGKLTVYVKNTRDLNILISKLRKIKGMEKVYRHS